MKKPVIICLDDEKIVLDSLKFELQKSFSEMLTVEIVETTDEAFELIDELMRNGTTIPIIISDWLMPKMKGDEFLIKVHSILPLTRKILLTGQATVEGIGNVVNKANLYRYIAKPWDNVDLDLTVTEAFKSYYRELKIQKQQKELFELNNSLKLKIPEKNKETEKQRDQIQEILNKTLEGFTSTLINVVSSSNRSIFEKSIRVKDITKKIINILEVENTWEFEMAALLCQLGCIDIDVNIVDKYLKNENMNTEESNIFFQHPFKTFELLNPIPSFENIAFGIFNMFDDEYIGEFIYAESPQALKISKILRIALDYDQNKTLGLLDTEILELFKNQITIYDPILIEAIQLNLTNEIDESGKNKIIAVNVENLKVGMKLSENLNTLEGKVILNSEDEINQLRINHIIQTKKIYG